MSSNPVCTYLTLGIIVPVLSYLLEMSDSHILHRIWPVPTFLFEPLDSMQQIPYSPLIPYLGLFLLVIRLPQLGDHEVSQRRLDLSPVVIYYNLLYAFCRWTLMFLRENHNVEDQ